MRVLDSRTVGRRCCAPLVVLLAAVGLLAIDPPGAAASHGCSARGKTVLHTPESRIFLRRRDRRDSDSDFNYFGCFNRKGSTYRLNLDDEYGNLVERFRLSGRYAAIVQAFGSGAGPDTDRLVITDLVSGRRLYFGPREGSSLGELEGGSGITDFLLKRNGSAAFVQPGSVATPSVAGYALTPTVRVFTVTAAGERVAAQSPRIATRSLRLSKDRRSLTYIEADQRRSVSFE